MDIAAIANTNFHTISMTKKRRQVQGCSTKTSKYDYVAYSKTIVKVVHSSIMEMQKNTYIDITSHRNEFYILSPITFDVCLVCSYQRRRLLGIRSKVCQSPQPELHRELLT